MPLARLSDCTHSCRIMTALHADSGSTPTGPPSCRNCDSVESRRILHCSKTWQFASQNVADLIRRLSLRGELFQRGMLEKDEWWIPDLARKLRVIQQRVHYWAKQGWVHSRKTPTEKHWIVWAGRYELKRLHGSYIAKKHPVLVTPKDHPADGHS